MTSQAPRIGVLALQGAFEEHQSCLEALGCVTTQVRVPSQLEGLDGIVFPGGESTAMGLIGSSSGMWDALRTFTSSGKPTWGTCAGMILLSEKCVGASAVIENGQSLIGGMNVLVCRNYFGSQISSFEMDTPCPPGMECVEGKNHPYPGVFIRAPAILNAGQDVEVLGKVVATPCRQAAAVLQELDRKISSGEEVIMMNLIDTLHKLSPFSDAEEEKKEVSMSEQEEAQNKEVEPQPRGITLPGAAEGTNAREVICAVRKGHVLCTAFHPELTRDLRWHEYFVSVMVKERMD